MLVFSVTASISQRSWLAISIWGARIGSQHFFPFRLGNFFLPHLVFPQVYWWLQFYRWAHPQELSFFVWGFEFVVSVDEWDLISCDRLPWGCYILLWDRSVPFDTYLSNLLSSLTARVAILSIFLMHLFLLWHWLAFTSWSSLLLFSIYRART